MDDEGNSEGEQWPDRSAPLLWSDAYSLGIPVIDADHQVLFELVDTFHSLPEPVSPVLVNLMLESLLEYCEVHFSREEAYQESIAYPGLAAHREEHAAFARQLSSLYGAYKEDPVRLDLQTLRRITRDWVVGHVMHSDLDIARFARGEEMRHNSQILGTTPTQPECPD